MKARKSIFIAALLLTLSACNHQQSESSASSSWDDSSISSVEEVDINDLINDKNAEGQYGKEDNVNRYPEDPLYDLVLQKKAVLQVNETYVEDFEKDYLYTRIYPISADDEVTYTYQSTGNCKIDGTSLCLKSPGNYQGIYFGGMKFAKNSTYHITFDYKIVVASNDFFFQFRSLSGGVSSDIYTVISGNVGDTGTIDQIFYLKDYSDYQLMLFPRNNKGTLAIDNISITRLNSKPQIRDGKIIGDVKHNQTLRFEYDYFDAENDVEKETKFSWFTSLDQNGKNKTIFNQEDQEITITPEMKGKYIGVSLIPYSMGDDEQCVGDRVDLYTSIPVDDEMYDSNQEIILNYNESFLEDFEEDVGALYNLYGNETEGCEVYVTTNEAYCIDKNKSLYFSSSGSYHHLQFSGIRFASKGIYEISFDYRFLEKGDNFYIQLRSASGDYSHDKYQELTMSEINSETNYSFKGQFALDGYSDYFLMMFPSAKGCKVILDNICIKRLEGSNQVIENVELQVNEKIEENFDDPYNLKFGIDNAQTPSSKITNEAGKVIEGGSLYIESDGSYHCLFINKGLSYSKNATYKISFDYQILSFVDTLYFQLNNGQNTYFKEFGAIDQIGTVQHFEESFTIDEATNYVMQFFPGSQKGTTAIIIDCFVVERIN